MKLARCRLTPALLALLACSNGGTTQNEPTRLEGMVAFPPRDTVRFAVPANAHRCAEGPTEMLLQASNPEGYGVLVRFRHPDSVVAGTYRAVIPGDTAGPTAVVAVRYQLRETAHSFAADSGTVEVHFEGGKLSGRIQTTGIENGIRTPTRITYHDVPAPARGDTVSCAAQP